MSNFTDHQLRVMNTLYVGRTDTRPGGGGEYKCFGAPDGMQRNRTYGEAERVRRDLIANAERYNVVNGNVVPRA